jgi:hypothetical protein
VDRCGRRPSVSERDLAVPAPDARSQAGSGSRPVDLPGVSAFLLSTKGCPGALARALLCAETQHASARVLAAWWLAKRSEQKSAALRSDFSNVAKAATRSRLPLPADSGYLGCIKEMAGIGASGQSDRSLRRRLLWARTSTLPGRASREHVPPAGGVPPLRGKHDSLASPQLGRGRRHRAGQGLAARVVHRSGTTDTTISSQDSARK